MKRLRGLYAAFLVAASTLTVNASFFSASLQPELQEAPRIRRNTQAPEDEPIKRMPANSPHMIPSVHPHLNKRDPVHLHSRRSAQLFYTQNGNIYLQDAAMVATLDAMFNWETVILDHTDYVSSVTCLPKQMKIKLNSLKSFNAAKANWTHDETIVFVSSVTSCHTKFPGQFGYFNTTSITFDQKSLTAAAVGTQISVKDAVAEFDIVWGKWDEMGQPKAASSGARVNNNAVVSTKRSSTTTSKKASTTTSKTITTSKKASTTTRKSTTKSSSSSKPAMTSSKTSSKTTTLSGKSSAKMITPTGKSSSTTSKSTTKKTSSFKTSSSALKTSVPSSKTASSTTTGGKTSTTSTPSRSSSSSSGDTTTTSSALTALPMISSATSTTSSVGFNLIPPQGTGICAQVPKPIPSPFSQYYKKLACDNSFDKGVDDFLTYLSDVANLQKYITLWAPNTGIQGVDVQAGGMRKRRGGILRRYSVGDFLEDCVDVIVSAVEALIDAAAAALDAIRDFAESILPTYHPSLSFGVPISAGAPAFMLDDSPWGSAYEIFKWTPSGGGELNYGLNMGALAKMTGADQIKLFEIDGITQLPLPGIKLWCVDCNVKGKVIVTGQATFTFPFGITNLLVKMDGDITANMGIGLDAFAEYTADLFKFRIFEIGVPGFYIPEVITVGPYISLDINAELKIEALGQFLASAEMHWEKIGFTIDFLTPILSKGRGFSPQVKPKFIASGNVTATASVGIPLGLNIGVDIFDGEWEKSIALVDRPAIQAVAVYSPVGDAVTVEGLDPCGGILYYANLVNEVELNIFDEYKYDLGTWNGKKFLAGCVGDNGVNSVRELLQALPAGKTQAGCDLITQVFKNPSFEATGGGSSTFPWLTDGGGATIRPEDDSNMHDGEVALQWTNEWVEDCGAFCFGSCGFAGFCENCCKPAPKDWSAEVKQKISMCTYSQYDFQLYSKLVNAEGICTITEVFVNNLDDANPNLSITVPVNFNILPVTGNNKNGQPLVERGFGIPLAIPATNNKASYNVEVGFRMVCKSMVNFDIRIDDLSLSPNDDAYANKRRQVDATTTPSSTTNNNLNALPALPAGTDAPVLTAVNAAPTVGVTQDAPIIPAANAAPTLAPANNAPAFEDIPQANLFTGTYSVGSPVPTANAVLLGPADYSFPAFSKIMASATLGVGAISTATPGSASSGVSVPLTGWSALSTLNGTGKLAAADDGNLYLSGGGDSSSTGAPLPGTNFYSEKSIAFKDEQNRMFHYYPETMAAYGVSRLRLSTIMATPLTAQLITLVPVDTPSGIAYLAADTARNNYYLATCTAPNWQGDKVFLVKNLQSGVEKLLSGEVQWIVTGNNVTDCRALVLTSGAGGLTPI